MEHIPENCPLMIVSNHQNGVCDPLGVLFAVRGRKNRQLKTIVRADVFHIPIFTTIVRWIGLLPAYRLSFDGENALANNAGTFEEVENELLRDGTVIIFPEAGHQDKHWLGKFSLAYLRILFETAKKSDFKKDLFILPTCNHYSSYFGVRKKMLVKFGTPVALSPYYELYKTKPWTAQRQVNEVIRRQISDMMLNITDTDNYSAIDYLRNTYGIRYAEAHRLNPDLLPDKLSADKLLFAQLEAAKTQGKNILKIYDDVRELKEKSEQLRIEDCNFDEKYVSWQVFGSIAIMVVLFPFAAAALATNILIFLIPRIIARRIKDRMLHSTVYIAVNVLVTFPLSCLAMFGLIWRLTGNLFYGLPAMLSVPLSGLFALWYCRQWKRLSGRIRFGKLLKHRKLDAYITVRQRVFANLDQILA
jgi:1-acyl-sn-glycerol-3-phosphate acyltransferase